MIITVRPGAAAEANPLGKVCPFAMLPRPPQPSDSHTPLARAARCDSN
jgi:hypothetical protein